MAVLALEDGSILFGKSVGANLDAGGEIVFNTSMTGYQEILTDPSYAQQIVALTYPHIGNTGINVLDEESSNIHASALIIKDLSSVSSNWRSSQTLSEYLKQHNVTAIANIDTRKLTRIIRTKGALRGWISSNDKLTKDELANYAITQANKIPVLNNLDLASLVTTKNTYTWQQSVWDNNQNCYPEREAKNLPYHVVVYDFGVKRNMMRILVSKGCKLTVVPATTATTEILKLKPDGILLSNGPGDPKACTYAIDAIQDLLTKNIPMLGICLGYQLLALAAGAKTKKMKFGHHGANHPVYDLNSKNVFISSQNHSFVVDENTLPTDIKATHISLFDGSLQGIEHNSYNAFGFQGHPEASPGPQELNNLFDRFLNSIKNK